MILLRLKYEVFQQLLVLTERIKISQPLFERLDILINIELQITQILANKSIDLVVILDYLEEILQNKDLMWCHLFYAVLHGWTERALACFE